MLLKRSHSVILMIYLVKCLAIKRILKSMISFFFFFVTVSFFLYPSEPSIIIASWHSWEMSVRLDLALSDFKSFCSSGTGLLSLIQTTSSSSELYTWNHTMVFPPRHFSCLPLLSDYLWKFYRKTNWVLQKYFLQGELTTTELKVGRKLRENIDNERRKDKNEGGKN